MSSKKEVGGEKRKLSIIFAADVAGYSRLMADNEQRTLALLQRSRKLIDKAIEDHGGRIANTAGDSVIAVFESATEALKCSLTIQSKLKGANAKFDVNKRLLFRIGLHMGEVYFQDRDILGEGVNIAARLEGSTEPGAICMSNAFFSVVDKGVSNLPVADIGHLPLKNMKPVQAYEMLSKSAKRQGVAFYYHKKGSQQKRRLIVLASALGVMVFSLLFAMSVAANMFNVFRMAEDNRSPKQLERQENTRSRGVQPPEF